VQILFPAIVLLACAWSFRRPVWAVVLMIFLFSIQQVLQAEAPWVRGTPLGNQLINYVVGSVAIFAAGITILRKREAFVGWVNFSFVVITALLAWSVVTLLWSPGRDLALQVLSLRWVYYVIFILVGPIIIADLDDIAELQSAVRSAIDDYLSHGDVSEGVKSIRELDAPSFSHEIINQMFLHAIGSGELKENRCIALLAELVTIDYLSPSTLVKGEIGRAHV
jgi:hypothetical protein